MATRAATQPVCRRCVGSTVRLAMLSGVDLAHALGASPEAVPRAARRLVRLW
jgi:hypothetical protein